MESIDYGDWLTPATSERGLLYLRTAPRPPMHEVLEAGWRYAKFPAVEFANNPEWSTVADENRSWAMRLHAWEFMDPFLRAMVAETDLDAVSWCAARAVEWSTANPRPAPSSTMAWYDMATSLRADRLGVLAARVFTQSHVDDSTKHELAHLLTSHRDELLSDENYVPHNNHGVYFALAGLALAARFANMPGIAELRAKSHERIIAVTERQFLDDGGHAEHSPDYHRMLLDTYSIALESDLIDDERLVALLQTSDDALGWMIQPDGHLAQLGDSEARAMRHARRERGSASTTFQITAGAHGAPDDRELFVLPTTGLAFIRSPQPTRPEEFGSETYLSLAAGFHSRTHKHADDLSITWFSGGEEVLVDAGRYGYGPTLPSKSPLRREGYFYADPERQYIESTRAHNTIEADGRDHQRRDRQPYGSALQSWNHRDGVFRIVARVDHADWIHSRTITLSPLRWLSVVDDVATTDGEPHEYRSWWNLADTVSVVPEANGAPSLRGTVGASGTTLHIAELSSQSTLDGPVTAREKPLRGWRSRVDRTLTPTWSFAFVADAPEHRFDTMFSLTMTPQEAAAERDAWEAAGAVTATATATHETTE